MFRVRSASTTIGVLLALAFAAVLCHATNIDDTTPVSTPGGVITSSPLVLSSMNGQQLNFNVLLTASDVITQFTYGIGTATGIVYPCNGAVAVGGPVNPQPVRCDLVGGVGKGWVVVMRRISTGFVEDTSLATVSYPPPVLQSTVRQVRTGFDDPYLNSLALTTVAVSQIQFSGQFFAPPAGAGPVPTADQYIITYGLEAPYTDYACAVQLNYTSAVNISCLTQAGSQGTALRFSVTIGTGQTPVYSNFTVSFPTQPFVTQVTGCTNSGNATVDCPTEGGTRLTIYGRNFVQDGLVVSIGARECTEENTGGSSSVITCKLPESNGGVERSVIVTSLGYNSPPALLVSYSLPTINSITGCTPGTSPQDIKNCDTHGNSQIVLNGINFGQQRAILLIGTLLCVNPVHAPAPDSHRRVTCTTPAGTGTDRPVLLLQNGGGIGSNVSLSYTECQPGTQIAGLDCSACETGLVSTQTSAQACNPCESGTYTGVPSGASACYPCPPGTASGAGQSACTNCTVGYYIGASNQASCVQCQSGSFTAANGSSICTPCPAGKSQSSAGKSMCNDCEIGKATDAEQQNACTPCLAGTYAATKGLHVCEDCEIGEYQPSASEATCLPCPVGLSSSARRQSSCAPCSPGTYRNITSGPACVACESGKYQSSSSQTACAACLPGEFSTGNAASCSKCLSGTMAPYAGSTTCRACPTPSQSNGFFTLCECEAGYYATTRDINMDCVLCPDGAVCSHPGIFVADIIADNGWWRASNDSLEFFQCLKESHCKNNGCGAHRTGPICAVCEPGYSQDSNAQDCTECPSHGASVGGTFGYTLLIVFAVVVVFYVVWRSEAAQVQSKNPRVTIKNYTIEDRVAPNYAYNFKIMLSYMQIATTLLDLTQIPWPTAFARFISYFSFVNLDFIPWGSVQCVATLDFYDKLVLIFIVPLIVIFAVVVIPFTALIIQNRMDFDDSDVKRVQRRNSRHKIVKLIVFALFLMYPAVSASVLSFFICKSVKGTNYLVADFNLVCGDERWNSYLPLAAIAVVLYPVGIPVILFVCLFRVRRRLKDPATILRWGLAYDAYRGVFWWWELIEMVTKLFLTSLLGFLPASAQCPTGMAICGIYLILILVAAPFVRRIDDRMCCVVQVHLFLILLIGFVLQNAAALSDAEDTLASVIMFFVLAALIALIIVHVIIFTRKYVRNVQRKQALREHESFKQNPLAKTGGGSGGSSSPQAGTDQTASDSGRDSNVPSDPKGGGTSEYSNRNLSPSHTNQRNANPQTPRESASQPGGSESTSAELGIPPPPPASRGAFTRQHNRVQSVAPPPPMPEPDDADAAGVELATIQPAVAAAEVAPPPPQPAPAGDDDEPALPPPPLPPATAAGAAAFAASASASTAVDDDEIPPPAPAANRMSVVERDPPPPAVDDSEADPPPPASADS